MGASDVLDHHRCRECNHSSRRRRPPHDTSARGRGVSRACSCSAHPRNAADHRARAPRRFLACGIGGSGSSISTSTVSSPGAYAPVLRTRAVIALARSLLIPLVIARRELPAGLASSHRRAFSVAFLSGRETVRGCSRPARPAPPPGWIVTRGTFSGVSRICRCYHALMQHVHVEVHAHLRALSDRTARAVLAASGLSASLSSVPATALGASFALSGFCSPGDRRAGDSRRPDRRGGRSARTPWLP